MSDKKQKVKSFDEYIIENSSVIEVTDDKIKKASLIMGLDLTKNLANVIEL